jgi:CRISPR/Cas system-associated exonuclease Cas4 (RecB family)
MANQFANFFFKRTPYDLKALAKIVDASYGNKINKKEFITKKSFSPSTVGYGSGKCPRRWVMAFQGAEFDNQHESRSVDNMAAGTAAHERIQGNFENANDFTLDIEWDLWVQDPPIHGFVDMIIRDYNGFDIVVEIKTTRTEAFTSRKMKAAGPDYQVLQLLLYMYFLEMKYGLLLYEDKNDHDKLLIPVEMTLDNRQKIEKVVEWMRLVYKTYQDDHLPERPYRKNSKICQQCPLLEWCGAKGVGDVKLESLEFDVN